MNNNNKVMAMNSDNNYIDKKAINTSVNLFDLLREQKQIVEQIHYFRNQEEKRLNFYESRQIIKLEQKNIELKQKISEIKKIFQKNNKKVTFNLKPLIKIKED
ncbi:putative effector, AYWB SAP21-like protein [Maize bushy stunt phytoplasma]|uniref:Effector, AYWB SAP21-like protein n=1 Tax=Maize bushy stunt phytoplasma TaxID=202462 RepID=A0ABN4S175_9MOLU|nr:putative effector, AYWB SAP21-like protein [Maize bushy stunt phytoplasma]